MRETIRSISEALNHRHREREDEVAGALLALLSGEHLLFIGPPGTGKSLMAKEVCQCLEDGNFYYYLLTRFTAPEEVFGPLSLSHLQQDEFRRRVEGYLPTADIAFLDEIFKANSSILNSLLTLLNERKYHNGNVVMDVPLYSVYGASNELPEADDGLEALYDRFLFRFLVRPISDESDFLQVVTGDMGYFEPPTKLGCVAIHGIQSRAVGLPVSDQVRDAIVALRRWFMDRGMYVSDRRWKKMVEALRVASVALDRDEVDISMMPLLQHMAWQTIDDRNDVRRAVMELSVSMGGDIARLLREAEELQTLVMRSRTMGDRDLRLPRPVHCHDCGAALDSMLVLKRHMEVNPNHSYMDPWGGIDPRAGDSLTLLSAEELVTRMEAEGLKVTMLRLGPQFRLYRRELDSLRDELTMAMDRQNGDRARFHQLVNSNLWLSSRDRANLLNGHGDRMLDIMRVRKVLDDIEANLADRVV